MRAESPFVLGSRSCMAASGTLALRVGEYVLVSEWWDEASFNSNKVHVALITKLSGESVRVLGAGQG